MTSATPAAASRQDYAGHAGQALVRDLAGEQPIAFEYNGVAYAVMMGTPGDLEDYAVGFSLSEGLIARPADLVDIAVHEAAEGWILRLTLAEDLAAPLRERIRLRVTEGSCGLCGLESIQAVLRPLPPVRLGFGTGPAAIQAALGRLADHQPVGALTGAMHAAAFCRPDGTIVCAREDIGRHNALDKLIGALARDGIAIADGFVLVSARCSYELVEKTVRAGCPMLVSISAASNLAVERARQAGLTLAAVARADNMLVFNDPAGVLTEKAP